MIRPAQSNDINALTTLHRLALPDTLNSTMGNKFISHLYRSLLSSKNTKVWVYVSKNNILGAISATTERKSITQTIYRSIKPFELLKVIIKTLLHPIKLAKHLSLSILLNSLTHNSNTLHILTLIVDPKYQRQGIGSKLIHHLDKFAINNHNHQIQLDTESSNTQAITFYKKNGYQLTLQNSANTILTKQVL